MSEPLRIRAIVQGYPGDMLCVYAAMDEASGFLLIDRAEKFDSNMDFTPDLTILTNVPLLPTWTMFFKEEQLKQAIDAYHTLEGNGLLEIESNMQRYNPVGAIQVNGMKESGVEYRFTELNNGHVGILICALFAEKQRNIRASLAVQVNMLNPPTSLPYAQPRESYVVKPMSVGYFF